jgi:dihydroflavonol-4-reductase
MSFFDGQILVTGANGHIGTNLVHELLAENESVRILVRSGSNTDAFKDLPVEVVRGEVCSQDDFIRATKGIRYVFHLASPTTITPDLPKVIKTGICNLLGACKKNNVEKVVYTSSAVTIGFSASKKRLMSEEDTDTFIPASPYHVAKYNAEKELLSLSDHLPFSLVTVNPTTVIGRFDSKITPSTMPAHLARKAGLKVWFDSGITVAPVRNVAIGHIQAMKFGKRNNRYILGGENLLIREYFSLINSLNHRKGPFVKLPNILMYGAGAAFSMAQALGYNDVPFDYSRIRALIGKYGFYSSIKATNELGYELGSAESAISDYYTWLNQTER